MLIEPAAGAWDTGVLREALGAVVAAHPQLRSRPGAADGRRTVRAGSGPADGQDPLVEREFTDEAGFAAILDRIGAGLDARTGVHLRLLLARDRRPGGPRADRLALLVHELAVDAGSWRILLDDLTTALTGAGAGRPQRPRRMPDPPAGRVGELRELARDPAEAQHWHQVAERRSRTPGTTAPPAGAGAVHRTGPTDPDPDRDREAAGLTADPDREAGPDPDREAGPDADPDAGAGVGVGVVRRSGFTLDRDRTERIVHNLARRLSLTTGQVLTGVFALALARWQRGAEVGFDVRSDPRGARRGPRRHAGRLTDPYPVQLTVDRHLGPLGQLTALAGPLAACAGRAGDGAGFGACREWSPDPALRRALRELGPARACLTLDGPGAPPPGPARPAAPLFPGHRVRVRAQVAAGRLHIGLDWTGEDSGGITDTSAAALRHLLRGVLEELAAVPAVPLPPAFRATPQQGALYTSGAGLPGTGHHVEQLVWLWHGPLDAARFTASWQSVFDCEAVLRTAFAPGPEPLLVVHERTVPEITHRVLRDDDWCPFLERDRLRGFDPHRPAALRLTLLHPEPPARTARPGTVGAAAPARIVLTYHRALLDTWSTHLLLREFYRAYLAGGTLPGGERRPDLRDYTAWAAAQDPRPAREFWTAPATTPPAPPATAHPAPPATGHPAGHPAAVAGPGAGRGHGPGRGGACPAASGSRRHRPPRALGGHLGHRGEQCAPGGVGHADPLGLGCHRAGAGVFRGERAGPWYRVRGRGPDAGAAAQRAADVPGGGPGGHRAASAASTARPRRGHGRLRMGAGRVGPGLGRRRSARAHRRRLRGPAVSA